jgi:hypothetical protein
LSERKHAVEHRLLTQGADFFGQALRPGKMPDPAAIQGEGIAL